MQGKNIAPTSRYGYIGPGKYCYFPIFLKPSIKMAFGFRSFSEFFGLHYSLRGPFDPIGSNQESIWGYLAL